MDGGVLCMPLPHNSCEAPEPVLQLFPLLPPTPQERTTFIAFGDALKVYPNVLLRFSNNT